MQLLFDSLDVDDALMKKIIRPPRNTYCDRDLGPEINQFSGVQTKHKNFVVLNKKGQQLKCSLFEPQVSGPMPLIIYLHGNAGNRLECMSLLPIVIKHRFAVLSFDFSGCGCSQGDIITLGPKEADDLECVIGQIQKTYINKFNSIFLWGRSMGAVVAILYCKRVNNTGLSGLILDSPFASFKKVAQDFALDKMQISSFFLNSGLDFVRQKLKEIAGLDMFLIEPVKDAIDCKIPAIFAYSYQDSLVNYEHSEQIMRNYGGNKKNVIFKGDHNCIRDNNYFNKILEFLQENTQRYTAPTAIPLTSGAQQCMQSRINSQFTHTKQNSQQQSFIQNQQINYLSNGPRYGRMQSYNGMINSMNMSFQENPQQSKLPQQQTDQVRQVLQNKNTDENNNQKGISLCGNTNGINIPLTTTTPRGNCSLQFNKLNQSCKLSNQIIQPGFIRTPYYGFYVKH